MGVVLPAAVASHYGALDIPRSDDWSYLVTLFRWVDHDRLGFNDWVSMTLIGQLVITRPVTAIFGNSITAVHLFSALIGFVGLSSLVWVGHLVLPQRRGATLIAVTIAVGPLWGPLAPTYMTDIPAFSAQMLSLGFAVRAFRGDRLSIGDFSWALGFGFLAISIRQYEVIPVIAIVLIAVWTTTQARDWARLRQVLTLGGLVGLATVGLLAWWSSLPDSLGLAPTSPASGWIANLAVGSAGFLRLAGLLLAPAIVLIGPGRIVRRAWRAAPRVSVITCGTTALWLTVTYLRVTEVPFVGNYVDRHGVLAEDVLRIGNRSLVMPSPLFDLLVVVGTVGGMLLALATLPFVMRFIERLRNRSVTVLDPAGALLGIIVFGFSAAYAIAIATDLPIFDRYALPVIPLVALLLVRGFADETAHDPAKVVPGAAGSTSSHRVAAVVSVLTLSVVGLIFSTDSASFDATRWRVASRATTRGFQPLEINGGFEWVTYHRRRGQQLGATEEEGARLYQIYLRGLCVDVVINPTTALQARAIARGTMDGLGHGPVLIIAVPNQRSCRR